MKPILLFSAILSVLPLIAAAPVGKNKKSRSVRRLSRLCKPMETTMKPKGVMMKYSNLFLILGVGLLMGATLATGQDRQKPNIILIYTDDHGWPDLGIQGILDDVRTPRLKKDLTDWTQTLSPPGFPEPELTGAALRYYDHYFGAE